MDIKRVHCPKCKGVPKAVFSSGEAYNTYICYQACGYIFWTLRLCPYCDDPEKTVILKKPNFGEKVACANCKHSVFFFRCPNQLCNKLFFKNENAYKMGCKINCEQCKFEYRTLSCPCGGEVTLAKDSTVYQGFSTNKCDCCGKMLIYTICPTCSQPQYHIEPLQIGERTRCSHCKVWRKYIPCPQCGISLKGDLFSFYEPIRCDPCDIYFEYCKCPLGCPAVSFNLLSKPMGPSRVCYNCKQQYFVINCKKCHNTLYQETMDAGEAIIDNCPHCKQKIQYYLCPCGLFNNDSTNCRNHTCPKPKNITDNIKRNEAEKKKSTSAQKTEESQCKLCFNAPSEYINEVCGHILMCEDCVKSYFKGKNSDRMPCPVCKTIGRYYKYKLPIYS